MEQLTSRLGSSLDRAAIEQLLDTCGDGGAEMVDTLLGTFFDDAPHLLAAARQATLEHDAEGARRAAHTLKSQGLLFGAVFLTHVAQEMEMLARDNDLDGAARLLGELEAEYATAREALEHLRQELLEVSGAPLAA